MSYRNVAEVVEGHRVVSLPVGASVRDAAAYMTQEHVASVVVTDQGEHVAGIFTERDLTARVVAGGLDPEKTPLVKVMTQSPITIAPDATVAEALRVMHLNGLRHLPVMEDGKVMGVVSMRDFIGAEKAAADREYETMDKLTEIL